ncbi:unnamed protein product [Coregonus sp. 'balchen']|nr:unnamed protein product [Coregonus sp. 'balchen']
MSEPKAPGSYCGLPAQRSSQWVAEERLVTEVENREEEEEVDGNTDPGESSNPGSDSDPSTTASGNHKQHRQRNSRQKHHHCMDCFTSFYEPEELRRHTSQRSSQWGPEMVLVKLEDCSQPLELNVIVKEEEEEREVKEEELGIKEEVEERAFKEEVEDRAFKEEVEERAFKEERLFKDEVEERAVTEVDNREEEEEVDGNTDPVETSNPGSDSEPSSRASGNHKQHRQRNSRQKHHHCMDCFTSFYEPEELRRHTYHHILPHPNLPTSFTSLNS